MHARIPKHQTWCVSSQTLSCASYESDLLGVVVLKSYRAPYFVMPQSF